MTTFEREIAGIVEAYKTAVLNRDVAAFVQLYADDVVVFDAWDVWAYRGCASWKEVARTWFGSQDNESIVVDADDLRIIGTGEVASVSAVMTYAANSPSGERIRALENRLTWVLRKTGAAWKIVHEHTSAPVRHGDLAVMLQRS